MRHVAAIWIFMCVSGSQDSQTSLASRHSSSTQEDDVRDIFAPYGPLDLVQIQRDGAGKSQGHGYVTCAPQSFMNLSIPTTCTTAW